MIRQDSTNDPRWARLLALAAGELPPEEAEALRRWANADPARREALAQIEAIWRATDVSAALDAADGEAALRRIKAEAGGGGRLIARVGPASRRELRLEMTHRLRPRFQLALRGAAVLALVAAGGLLWRLRRSAPVAASAAVAMTEYRTGPGERLSLHLPDGTEVQLAPGGVLRRSSDYGVRHRFVQLEGEAYFTVPHDAARPFVVSTRRAVVHDLGTRFVVRAYSDEPVTDIVVAEGRVAVRPTHVARATVTDSSSFESVVLNPYDRATVTVTGELQLTRGVRVDRYLNWTDGRLAFENTSLRDVVWRLERWYGVDIRLADPSLGDRYVTVVLRHETAAEAVDLVATVLRLEVSRSQGAYVLSDTER